MDKNRCYLKPRFNPLSVLAALAILLASSCGGGGGGAATTATVPASGSLWTAARNVDGTFGKYTPLVVTGPDAIRVYANSNGAVDGTFFLREGSFTNGVGAASVAISPSQLTDMPGGYIRTTAVVKGAQRYYALLHVGNAYTGNTTGFQPAWATSDDTINWQYHGRIKIDGTIPYVFASGAALVVQEDKPATIDTANPANNRFLVWEDAYTIDGVAKKLVLIYSADGVEWHFYRDANNQVVDVWPKDPAVAGDTPVFPTAARTPYGYHLIAADKYPAAHHRHLWSCDGLTWRVLEANAPTFIGTDGNAKGTNLAYDPSTGLVHAITSINERLSGSAHWTFPAQSFPC